MNSGIVQLQLWQFSLIYLLLIIVIAIMKKSGVEKTRLLVEEVDMISLARKRAVTVPLVKEAMQTLDTHVQQELF